MIHRFSAKNLALVFSVVVILSEFTLAYCEEEFLASKIEIQGIKTDLEGMSDQEVKEYFDRCISEGKIFLYSGGYANELLIREQINSIENLKVASVGCTGGVEQAYIFNELMVQYLGVGAETEGIEEYREGKHYYWPKEGFVSSEETAVKIAEAVWLPIYGEQEIYTERPFKANLNGEVWYVSGSLPEGWKGGVAEAEINKKDGKILRVSHGE